MKLNTRGGSSQSSLRTSLQPTVIVVLPVMTLLTSACSSSALETAPRPGETTPISPESDPSEPVLDARAPDPQQDTPQASAALLLSCAHGDVRACTYYLPEHNGVRQCVIGYQICSDGEWSPCVEGATEDGGAPVEPERSF
jgi:hypothetical protein